MQRGLCKGGTCISGEPRSRKKKKKKEKKQRALGAGGVSARGGRRPRRGNTAPRVRLVCQNRLPEGHMDLTIMSPCFEFKGGGGEDVDKKETSSSRLVFFSAAFSKWFGLPTRRGDYRSVWDS